MISRIPKTRKRRRGRIIDRKFMDFARSMGCILRGRHVCQGCITFHHVRDCGSPKDDTRGVGLCVAGHLYEGSMFSVERLGKAKFQEHWHVDLEYEIARLRLLYQERKAA